METSWRWSTRRQLVTFFVLAYGLSWAVEIPLAASAQGWTRLSFPFALHYVAAYGPLLAACITTWWSEGSGGLKHLLGRLLRWRVRPGRWWLAALAPLWLFVLVVVALRVFRGAWVDVAALGQVNYLPALGPAAFVFWVLTFGIGEETGWRGFALPRLQRGHSALAATLVLAVFWVLWHLPTFFYLETYVQLGLTVLPGFVLGIVAGAVVFTWLYNGTQGSLLMVAVGHASLNFVTASPAGDQTVAAAISAVIMVWAVVVVLVWKPATLAPGAKQLE